MTEDEAILEVCKGTHPGNVCTTLPFFGYRCDRGTETQVCELVPLAWPRFEYLLRMWFAYRRDQEERHGARDGDVQP